MRYSLHESVSKLPLQAGKRPALIALLSVALYLPGIGWGLPTVVSWSQDTIAGVRTLGAVQTWPRAWSGRYPPLHYLVNRVAYQPLLAYWRGVGAAIHDPTTGQLALQPPHPPKVGALVLISRLLSVMMAVAAVMLLWVVAASLTGDRRAASFAAVAFAGGAAFTYFAHLGNVDVPSVFWLACSLVFYARTIKSHSWLDAGLLGLTGSLCISTKDNWAGLYPGMAVMLLIEEWRLQRRCAGDPRRHAEGSEASPVPPGPDKSEALGLARDPATGNSTSPSESRPSAGPLVRAFAQWRWLVGIVAFVVPYALLNGIPWNPAAWIDRLRALADAIEPSEYRHQGAGGLALESLRQAACAVGWPMLVAMIAACGYGLWRRPRLSAMLLLPCASYYAIVIAQIGFVYERFLLGPLMLLSILVGIMLAELTSRGPGHGWVLPPARPAVSLSLPKGEGRVRVAARWLVATLVLLPTAGYAVAVDLEMMTDSRYAAEEWFDKHVPRSANVGALAGDLAHFAPQYLPRVHEMGYATFPVLAAKESFDRPQPEVLILSSYDQQDFTAEQRRCVDELMAGELGYESVAVFRGGFLGTGSSWLSLAGWYAPTPGKISPTITVFRRSGSRLAGE